MSADGKVPFETCNVLIDMEGVEYEPPWQNAS